MFALACWTLVVLLLIPLVRVRSALRREIRADDFKFGESAAVPGYVSIPNRNYMNLLELPMLFYVVCLLLYVTGGASTPTIALAWAYVVLRVVHSAIHLSYNHVIHRLAAVQPQQRRARGPLAGAAISRLAAAAASRHERALSQAASRHPQRASSAPRRIVDEPQLRLGRHPGARPRSRDQVLLRRARRPGDARRRPGLRVRRLLARQ